MGNSWCCGGQPSANDGSVLDRVISQASNEDECLLYRMANYKKGGELIDAYNVGGQSEVEKLIKEQFGVLMYNEGRGQTINRAEYLRWKFRDQDQVVLPIEASLSAHDPLSKWEDHEACWQMQYRGSLGESLLHVLIICDTKLHTRLARTLLKCFPKQALDIVEGEDYLGASALHLAIAYANNELVQDLVEAGANVCQRAIGSFFLPRDQQRTRPAKHTDYEGLAYLGEYPLSWAACCANESVYNLLLDSGAHPDLQDTFGNMILHMVVVCDKLDMFGYALRHPKLPAKNGIANHSGLTPLTLACKLGRAEVFREMLELSAREFWRYSNITCSAYPLNALDTLLPDGRTNWNSALFIILNGTKEEHLDMLDGGIIQRLLEEKWKTFARNQFLKRLLILALHLFTLSMAVYLRPADSDEPLFGRLDWSNAARYGFEVGTIASVVSYVVFQQGEEIKNQGLFSFIKQLPHAPAKAIFLVSNLLILACIPFRLLHDKRTEEAILTIAVPGSWFLLMFFAGAVRLTGPFVTMVYSMITGDMLTFGIIYTVVLFGFSQSFFFLYKGYPGVKSTLFHSYPTTWMALFQITLGDYNYAELANLTYPGLSKSVFAIFMVLVPILLLNMLIAMMGNTYAHVIEQSEKEWVKQWAKIVVTLERAVKATDAHHYLQEYSIKLGPGDDPSTEQRGVMVIKSKSKTRAKQRKGAVMNWKRVGKVTIRELTKRKMTGEQLRRLMWERTSISTPVRIMSPDLLDGEPVNVGFGGALSAALDVMAFTNDLDLPGATQVVGGASPVAPPPVAPPPTAPPLPGQQKQPDPAGTVFSQLTSDIPPGAADLPPAYALLTPPPSYPPDAPLFAASPSSLPPAAAAAAMVVAAALDPTDVDPLRQLVAAADTVSVRPDVLADLARRAALVEELALVSHDEQHKYCCVERTHHAARTVDLAHSDSDTLADGPLLGRGSRMRRARSARQRSAGATVSAPRSHRRNHASSSSETDQPDFLHKPPLSLLEVAAGGLANGHSPPAAREPPPPAAKTRPKTARNRVAPTSATSARRGQSAAAVQSVRPQLNGAAPTAPTSPPDPLDAWSTKDIANMNSLLAAERGGAEDSM